jgi:ACS family sodium-dependent inorganic phosphate cotransporter
VSAFGISGVYFGAVVAMLLSGWIATAYGWEWIFYVFGIAGIVWCILWFFIVHDSPSDDFCMLKSEKKFILDSLKKEGNSKNTKTPWLAIFTSMPVYAVSVAHFAYAWGYYTLLTQLPSYMRDIVHFDLTKSGYISAVPYIVLTILLIPSGILADWFQIKNLLSTSQVRKFFNNVSFFGQMIFLLLAGYFTDSTVIIICITISIGLGAFSMSGFLVNTLDIAPQYSSIILGFSNSIATLPGLISPIVTGYIVQTPVRTSIN